ncbi:hypothetical protein EJA71_26825 [Pseudomonas sp. PB106]|nr:hypothetical protein EJA71_26825 [Pseudomonas sp. PB106]
MQRLYVALWQVGEFVFHNSGFWRRSTVGVSLLAIAVYQPPMMANGKPRSRAGSLLQGFTVI